MENENKFPLSRHSFVWACVASVALLSLFLWLQSFGSKLVDLPVQWIGVSLIPILLALIVGGYVSKLKLPGVEYEGPRVPPNVEYVQPTPGGPAAVAEKNLVPSEAAPWTVERAREYQRTNNLFLVHVYKPSTRPGQLYDITIFLMRHVRGPQPNQVEGFDDVEKAEFFFGESWGNQVFAAHNDGSFVGVSTSAWGTFLATCRVTFKGPTKPPVILHRYIDFEMVPRKV